VVVAVGHEEGAVAAGDPERMLEPDGVALPVLVAEDE